MAHEFCDEDVGQISLLLRRSARADLADKIQRFAMVDGQDVDDVGRSEWSWGLLVVARTLGQQLRGGTTDDAEMRGGRAA